MLGTTNTTRPATASSNTHSSRMSLGRAARGRLRARRVLHAGEWPVRFEPLTHGVVKGGVQVRVALPHPRECAGVVVAVAERVGVDAPEAAAAGRIEQRLRQPRPT